MIKRKYSRIMCLFSPPPPHQGVAAKFPSFNIFTEFKVRSSYSWQDDVVRCKKTFPSKISIFLQMTLVTAILFSSFHFHVSDVSEETAFVFVLYPVVSAPPPLILMSLCGLFCFWILKFQLISSTSAMMQTFGWVNYGTFLIMGSWEGTKVLL